MKNKRKITGVLFFVMLVIGIAYLAIFNKDRKNASITKISICGNKYLTSQLYKEFAKLDKISSYRHLSLPVIKDRLEKHPYVAKANVKQNGSEVVVTITEKKFKANCLYDSNSYLLGEDYQMVPLFPFTENMDLPVISNIYPDRKIKRNTVVKTNDFITAVKIIDCLREVNGQLYNELSEINMNEGKDVNLLFRNFDCSVIFGRGNEVRKAVYLNKMWPKINGSSADSYVNFIDLRFDKKIYFGMKRQEVAEEGA